MAMERPYKHLRYNFIVNVFDGSFFGLAMGFASFVTILPLFVSTLTDSVVLIGLIPAIRNVGWQLPQLFMAYPVARLRRYKPMVVLMTIQERVPFLGLAAVAWFLPVLKPGAALWLTFGLLIWQGLGGGLAANAWQSMISKIIPPPHRGSFFGIQAAAANLLASASAVIAGILLEQLDAPFNFTVCFLLTSVFMGVSLAFLSLTREQATPPKDVGISRGAFWSDLGVILRRDANFRWFLVTRLLAQMAVSSFAFYTIYAVRHHGASASAAGVMGGVFLAAQITANPIMGWLGDRWSHRAVMEIGAAAAIASALLACGASEAWGFYIVFTLAGVANVAFTTLGLTMTLEFGAEAERPAYIGLANTLTAPAAILAPLISGWIVDAAGYPAAFLVSALGGLLTALGLHWMVRDPRSNRPSRAGA